MEIKNTAAYYALKFCIETSLNNRHYENFKIVSNGSYLIDYATIRFSLGRQSGNTTNSIFLATEYFENVMLISRYVRTNKSNGLFKEKNIRCVSLHALDIEGISGIESDCVIIDDASQFSSEEIKFIYEKINFLCKNKDFTVLQVG